jgi:uncharacterized protein
MGQPVAFFELPPTDLPEGFGRIAVFTDPDGNQVGLWA